MNVIGLDHYTINTGDLDASIAFYETALGLRNGDRPAFTFPGAWLYCGGSPVVHLVGGRESKAGTGVVDHVAFHANGLPDFIQHLREHAVPFRERDTPDGRLHQVFLEDPNGVTIELNFLNRV
jgi:catechol 2,3-dioxygenase-like lactoylglutathione lyase family enzyme